MNERTKSQRNALLDELAARYPVFRDALPLALGIHKLLLEQDPTIDVAKLKVALRIHTASTRYLKGLSANTQRFNLAGEPAGEVTDEQRTVAKTQLAERQKRFDERRKAEQKAKQEQEAQSRRQEKLNQLAARFNSR